MKTNPRLDYVAFAVRYGSGYLYFDRCGQCLFDIERRCPGWGMVSVDIHTGRIENPEKSLIANFSDKEFSFTSQKPYQLSIEEIANEIAGLWNIIKANLALEEMVRVGVRFNYLIPTKSNEESAALLEKLDMNIIFPSRLQNETYSIKNRHIIAVLSKDEIEYRVELAGVVRHEGLDPSELVRTDPRLLSKKQRELRLAKLKQLAEYSANPMFAVHLNVDCASFNVESFSAEEYVLNNAKVVKEDFLPLLNKL